ncbi:hypothetical protein AVEN_135767-1 [Araneus ventricosus]|uniref:Uncharacterized protein n=1 Tax=Araneus ventricosus TaxID=182803 RepID=A0A4Y2CAV6_ARAVE|nr:hypothetical protein AVEN_135767-1 [Araneus ventricosus]
MRREVEDKAYVAATPARSCFLRKNRAEHIFGPERQIFLWYQHKFDAVVLEFFERGRELERFREQLLDRRSFFTSCRKNFYSLRSSVSPERSELTLEDFEAAGLPVQVLPLIYGRLPLQSFEL